MCSCRKSTKHPAMRIDVHMYIYIYVMRDPDLAWVHVSTGFFSCAFSFQELMSVHPGSCIPNGHNWHFKPFHYDSFSSFHSGCPQKLSMSSSFSSPKISSAALFSLYCFCRKWRSVLPSLTFSTWSQLHLRRWLNLCWRWWWRRRGPCS